MMRTAIRLLARAACWIDNFAFQWQVQWAAGRAISRMWTGRLSIVWFDGIPDWKVNAIARTLLSSEEPDGDNLSLEDRNLTDTLIAEARRERNRRYPARIGRPASCATRRYP